MTTRRAKPPSSARAEPKSPSPKRARRTYSADERRSAVEHVKAAGLAATHRTTGIPRRTLSDWTRAAGIDLGEHSRGPHREGERRRRGRGRRSEGHHGQPARSHPRRSARHVRRPVTPRAPRGPSSSPPAPTTRRPSGSSRAPAPPTSSCLRPTRHSAKHSASSSSSPAPPRSATSSAPSGRPSTSSLSCEGMRRCAGRWSCASGYRDPHPASPTPMLLTRPTSGPRFRARPTAARL